MPVPEFRPVIMGSDLGVYSLARAFHEAYGVRSTVVSNSPRGPILNSAIIQPRYAGAGASPQQTLALLEQIAAEHTDVQLLLVPTAEHELDLVAEHSQQLSQWYVISSADPGVLERSRDKRRLEEACARLGLLVPGSVPIEVPGPGTTWSAQDVDLTYPVVLKPANSGDYSLLPSAAHPKVQVATSPDQVQQVIGDLAGAGYTGVMLAQELVPGDETASRMVTCYVDRDGRITMTVSAQFLLGMHSPAMLGVSAAVLTEPQPDLVAQAERIVADLDLRGFVNFDLKIDPRDGRARFLDLNARVGRSNHHLLIAGVNPAVAIVEDHLLDRPGQIQTQDRVGVYAAVPKFWLNRYLTDPRLRARVRTRWRATTPSRHPLVYRADRNLRRWWYRMLATVNLVRSFRRHYPSPTETGL